MKNKIFILVIIIAVLAIIGSVSAADITIGPNTPGGLKEAIDTVSDGKTVYMEKGVYSGDVNNGVVIRKNITIQGKGNNVTIDAEGKNFIFLIYDGATVTLKNLKMVNGYVASHGGAIYDNRGTLTIIGCTFNNNIAKGYINSTSGDNPGVVTPNLNRIGGDGGAIYSSGDLNVVNCIFTNNQANNKGGAISVYNGNLSVVNCIFTNNQAYENGGAIYAWSDSEIKLDKTTFKNNTISRNNTYNALCYNNAKLTKTGVTITPTDGTKVVSANSYPIKKADLKITKITKKSSYHYVAIKNAGKKSTAKKFYLGIYVGTKLIKKLLVSSIGAGKSVNVRVSIAKKYKNSLKTFKADSTNIVKESNEKNNSLKAR